MAVLEEELVGLGAPGREPALPRGAALLTLGELEAVRDELAVRVDALRRAADERGVEEERNRVVVEEMLLHPAGHRWLRVPREALGEKGCGGWHARPRMGPLGMLLNWWRVVVSSGCP